MAVAAIGVPLAAVAATAGGWVLGGFLAALAALAGWEFSRLAARTGARPFPVLGAGGAAALVLLAAGAPGAGPDGAAFGGFITLLTLAAAAVAIWRRGAGGGPLVALSATVVAAVYTGATLAHALFIRHFPGVADEWHGLALLFLPVLLTWSNDTASFFAGRRWGSHKLMPAVSPGKTVEGAAGGVAAAVVVALLYGLLLERFPAPSLAPPALAGLGVLVALAAQLGDLVESLLKRDAGVKDSGTLLPGHGGVLDRLDSLVFTLPLSYLFLVLFAV
ncbi:MAG: phosphatidate cytidylyltransferase [Longimicrobiaceae bacterium]